MKIASLVSSKKLHNIFISVYIYVSGVSYLICESIRLSLYYDTGCDNIEPIILEEEHPPGWMITKNK